MRKKLKRSQLVKKQKKIEIEESPFSICRLNIDFLESQEYNLTRLSYGLTGLRRNSQEININVLKWFFNETLRPLFENIPFNFEKGIVLTTTVYDGMGDFFGLLQIAKQIALFKPGIPISININFDAKKNLDVAKMQMEKISPFFLEKGVDFNHNLFYHHYKDSKDVNDEEMMDKSLQTIINSSLQSPPLLIQNQSEYYQKERSSVKM